MNRIGWIVSLILGAVIGFLAANWWSQGSQAPGDWIARVDDQYVTQAEFENEMRRRAGARPGRFHSEDQRQRLLDDLLFRRALVARAQAAHLDQGPSVRRSLDQILINQVLEADLRPRQEQGEIDPADIQAFYDAHADEYAIPARRRVAMVHFRLGPNASEETRAEVHARAAEVHARAMELDEGVRDFGQLAREYSDHQSSRYRGGVLGWISEGEATRYSHPGVVVDTANGMTEPGRISEIVEDDEGLYLVRLVDHEPRRNRTLEELADGIRQRLMRERFRAVETAFRDETLARADIEVRSGALSEIEPPGPPPAAPGSQEPPPLPDSATGGN